jgi:hypothetical protein
MPNEMKESLRGLLPNGPIWNPKPSGDFDKLLDGMGENAQALYEFLATLKVIRDPYQTNMLPDLEREYGIVTNTDKSDTDRRNAVAQKRYAVKGHGSLSDLQEALDNAGFNLIVHENNPPIDPNSYFSLSFQTIAGETLAQAGEPDALAGMFGFGELIVNGPWYDVQEPEYFVQAGETDMEAGEPEALAGNYNNIKELFDSYIIGTDPTKWRFIFFVAGAFTGWTNLLNDWNMISPGTDEWSAGVFTQLLKAINSAAVPDARVLQVKSLANTDQQLASLPVNVEDTDIVFRLRMYDPGDNDIRDLTYDNFALSYGTPAVNTFTIWGRGLTFDGSNDYLDMGTSPLATDSTFTLTAIIKLGSSGTSKTIMSRRDATNTQWEFLVDALDKLNFYDGSTFFSLSPALNTTDYYYVGVSVNGSSSFMWHVNLTTGTVTTGTTFNPSLTNYTLSTLIGAYNAGALRHFNGDILFPEGWSKAFSSSDVTAEKDRILLQKVAEFSDWRENAISDGSMDSPNLTYWTAGNDGVISKVATGQYDGTRFLRVTKGGAIGYCGAYQVVASVITYEYEVYGRAKSQDGVSIPVVYICGAGVQPPSGDLEWTGTTSTSWQYFYFRFPASVTKYIWLSMQALTGTGVDFDEVYVKIIPDKTAPWVAQHLTDSTGNFDGVSENTENKYNQFGKGRSLAVDTAEPNLLNSELSANSLGVTFSLSCWAKVTNGVSMILFSAQNSSTIRWEYGINASGFQYFYDGTTTWTGATNLSDGKYHHYTACIDTTNSVLYSDGSGDTAPFSPSITGSVPEPIKIASNSVLVGNTLNGLIVIPRIYTKKLSSAEALAQKNADASVILKGSYAEQKLDTPILASTTVSAKAYTAPQDVNVPAIYGYNPTLSAWEEIAFGARGVIETLSGEAPNGITRIRLYNKFSYDSDADFFQALLSDQTIARGQVQFNRKEELRTIILDKKPLHSWCGLIVEYI